MTAFTLKMIAIISMVLDHVKYAIPQTNSILTSYLGRLAFPIFSFLISEGFVHTHNRGKYILRILIFAIISQLPFYFFSHNLSHSKANLNILFTFEFALIGLYLIELIIKKGKYKKLNYLITIIILAMILIIAYLLHPDYSIYGIGLVWLFYLFRNSMLLKSIGFMILNILQYKKFLITGKCYYIFFSFMPLMSLIFILLYNGKQGRKMKYFFYLFYPLHFIILYLIHFMI